MPTFTALTTLKGRDAAEALGEAMERLCPAPTGVGVFELEDGSGLWEVGGYFNEEPDRAGLALLATMHDARTFAVSELPEVDWVAKVRRELAPVEAGRFFVYGSHDADKVPDNRVALLIEAAMAFGTGHHGTTQGCLLALDRLAGEGVSARSVLDLGCGTAVLAMAAARIWPGLVLASDIDDVAIEVAHSNVTANALEGRVRCLRADGLDHEDIERAAPFDLVFANILKAPLTALAPAITARMRPGGHVILSGILNDQAEEVGRVYSSLGNDVIHLDRIGDWATLTVKNVAQM